MEGEKWETFVFSSSSVYPTSDSLSCFCCVSCVSRRFSPALAYFLHPIIPEKVCSRSLDCGQHLARNPPLRHISANVSLCTAPYLNCWKRLSPKVVKDRSYFTESASFQLTKLTGLTCSFRYQKPTDFHRKRLNLLTQKPLYLHVTLNILDD